MFRERQKVERDVQLSIMVLASKETVMPGECSDCSSWIRAGIHCYKLVENTGIDPVTSRMPSEKEGKSGSDVLCEIRPVTGT